MAPGRLAPPAMPNPLTGAAGASAVSAAGAWATGASTAAEAAFLAPGRLAPPAMPRPVTGLDSDGALAPDCADSVGAPATFSAGVAVAVSALARGARFSASFAAVPFSGRTKVLLSSEPSSSWATSRTSAFSTSRAAATSSTPSVIITRQNGHPVAILEAPVSRASSTRSVLTRLPMCSSIHIRAPPAPQHRPRSACRGISVSLAPDAPISSRGAS